jgi:hypothetical protein
MSESEKNGPLFQTHVMERASQYQRLFGQQVWKQGLQAWLAALAKLTTADVVYGHNTEEQRNIKRGMVMAFEQIINLPAAIQSSLDNQKKVEAEQEDSGHQPARGDATDYAYSHLDDPSFLDED